MKYKIGIVLLTLLTSCGCKYTKNNNVIKTDNKIKVEHLMDEMSFGLNKVVLEDSTTILIYRVVESCTMIELK